MYAYIILIEINYVIKNNKTKHHRSRKYTHKLSNEEVINVNIVCSILPLYNNTNNGIQYFCTERFQTMKSLQCTDRTGLRQEVGLDFSLTGSTLHSVGTYKSIYPNRTLVVWNFAFYMEEEHQNAKVRSVNPPSPSGWARLNTGCVRLVNDYQTIQWQNILDLDSQMSCDESNRL